MRKRKIDLEKLKEMLIDGKSPKYCSEFFGVSPAATCKARKSIDVAVVKNVALESAPAVVEKNLDVIEQLQGINEHANWLLDHVMSWIKGDDAAIQILEKSVKKVNVGTREEPQYVDEFKFKDPHEIALKAMAEIRNQSRLQLEIFQTLYDMRAVQQFQEEVLSAIGEASPDVRQQIINKLRERQALRSTLRFD
jgi:hypothetical protein